MLGVRRIAVPDVPDTMLWVTVLGGVLVVAALCLVVAATIKHLFFR